MRNFITFVTATTLIAGSAFAQAGTAAGSNIYTKDGGTVGTASSPANAPAAAPKQVEAPKPKYEGNKHSKKAAPVKKKPAAHKAAKKAQKPVKNPVPTAAEPAPQATPAPAAPAAPEAAPAAH